VAGERFALYLQTTRRGEADMAERRRLERPWMVEETNSAFIVRTANHLVVSLILLRQRAAAPELQPDQGRARRVARSIARLPDILSPRE
jgi:hypothetical protein